MGVYNDVKLCYGIEVDYKTVVALKERSDFKEIQETIGCGYMPNIWQEMGHISCAQYYDAEEEYHCYIIGKEIQDGVSLTDFLKQVNEDEMKDYLQDVCRDYNIKYSEPRIVCKCNIY